MAGSHRPASKSCIGGLGVRKGSPALALDSDLPTLQRGGCTSCPGSGCSQLARSRPRLGSALGQVTLLAAAFPLRPRVRGSPGLPPVPQFAKLRLPVGSGFSAREFLASNKTPVGFQNDQQRERSVAGQMPAQCPRGLCPCPWANTAQGIS